MSMMPYLDRIPLLLFLVMCILGMVAFIEFGFRLGRRHQAKPHKAQMAQVRAIMGASLGLLAFMLAFSFSMAQQNFQARIQAYMLEVSAIDSAFRGADLLDGDAAKAAQDILRRFAALRLEMSEAASESDTQRVFEMVRESERMHDQLWKLAESAMDGAGEGAATGIFAQSVLAMIDAQDARLQAALFNRISPVIWITLYLMALLSMVVMGYQAGLTGTRSSIATWTLAITFSAVMALVTDLDRPIQSLFSLNQGLMMELNSRMDNSDQSSLHIAPQE
jgi:hypothetical protein